ncbi:MAG: DUF4091 domain-containing protein [Ignavibacteriales bacterium]|nr:DUF4091 domain-containing protein [Ignavibacteriales bacterium]
MKRQFAPVVFMAMFCFLTSLVVAGEGNQQPTSRSKPVVGLFDELQELYPDTKLDQPVKLLTVHAARNSIASVHLMVGGLQGTETISFTVSDVHGKPTYGARWYRMIDVPVTENTGLDHSTEKFSGMVNPYVIRRAPFRIFDPLKPVHSPIIADSACLALRLEIPIDAASAPGEYIHRIRLDVGDRVEVLDFIVVVHRALVPPVDRSTISYINWHNLDNICRAHGVERWSEPFWDMLSKYAQTMARGRQNAFWFIWGDFFAFDSAGNVSAFRRDLLERYIRVFLHAGFRTIQGAPFAGRRNWTSSDMLLTVQGADGVEVVPVSEKGKRMISQMATRIIAMMKENRWDGQWLQGVFDEPTDEFVDRYKEIIAVLRALKPDIKILEATMTVKLSGVVDVWCPQVQEYQAHQVFFDQRKAAGDKVWVYTCLSPGGPWLNRLLDQERLRQVYIGWACAKYDLQGFLHWGLNFHTDKPFEELVRPHIEGQFLPAGDSHILYPMRDGPLSSHRFESHRIGMEDYELLAQLKSHDAARAQQIIARVLQAFDKYSKDIGAYRAARKLLLEAVDQNTLQ